MLLIVTNGSDATADYLQSRLMEASVPFVRFDTNTALERVELSFRPGNPSLQIDGQWYHPDDFSNVWYRRPERLVSNQIPDTPEGKCALDEWSESLEGFFAHIPRKHWMNFPAANALASRKLEQLSNALHLGFTIPDTIVTQDAHDLRTFFDKHNGEIIVKPLGRAYIERPDSEFDSIIFTNPVRESDLEHLDDLARCPTLFQQSVRKHSDVRITIVDGDVHAFELTAKDIDGQQRCDIRRNNMQDVKYRTITIPQDVTDALQRLVASYGLRFAAIDMAVTADGQWYFFEVNPNGQWAWLDLCGGATIYKSFIASFSVGAKSPGVLA
jgi:hypothetical protein